MSAMVVTDHDRWVEEGDAMGTRREGSKRMMGSSR